MLTSSALTLGRLRGSAWIGQPLDVAFPLQVDNEDEARLTCYAADVVSGDAAIDPARVRLAVEPGSSAQEFVLRVRSTSIIEEPVVTVTVRSNCGGTSSRKFVLLADLPNQAPVVQAAPIAPTPLPNANLTPNTAVRSQAPSATAPAASQGSAASGTASLPAASNAEPAARPAQRRTTPPRRQTAPASTSAAAPSTQSSTPAQAAATSRAPVPAVAPARSAQPAAATAAPATPSTAARTAAKAPVAAAAPAAVDAAKPRLKLDSVDALADSDLTLKSSTQMLTMPETSEQKRAEAAATWKSLNTDPLDAARGAQRMQTLEGDVQKMREMMVRNQAMMLEMQTQLQRAESERYANPLVYALAALLLLALAAIAILWKRTSESGKQAQWWAARDREAAANPGVTPSQMQPELSLPPDFLASEMASQQANAIRTGTGKKSFTNSVSDVDFDLGDDIDSGGQLTKIDPTHLATAAVAARREGPMSVPPHADFSPSVSGRMVNAEELFDIQQQADFFVSLGQYDQAIDVLKAHINANPDTSALAYLDLFTIYHELENEVAYNALRVEFSRIFNADVPTFAQFRNQSRGLEDYPRTLGRITKSWPKHRVLRIIEESIFRRPGALEEDVAQAFDLEAYRELLLLFAIAKDVADEDSQDFLASSSDSLPSPLLAHSIPAPLGRADYANSANDMNTVEIEALPEIVKPPSTPNLGIDIDLTDHIAVPDVPSTISPDSMGTIDARESKELDALDFDMFDSSTEAQLAPKRPPKR